MSPVNSMFVCIKKKNLSANLFWKWPISVKCLISAPIIGPADNRSTPSLFAQIIRDPTSATDEVSIRVYESLKIAFPNMCKLAISAAKGNRTGLITPQKRGAGGAELISI